MVYGKITRILLLYAVLFSFLVVPSAGAQVRVQPPANLNASWTPDDSAGSSTVPDLVRIRGGMGFEASLRAGEQIATAVRLNGINCLVSSSFPAERSKVTREIEPDRPVRFIRYPGAILMPQWD